MQNEQENSKNQKEEDTSIPLLDLNQSSIKKLLSQAKSKGYLTYSELNETMPPGEMSSEQIEDIMTALSEMGITLIESEEEQDESQGKQENETEENIQSRIRGLLLMALSNKYGSMLLTTGNKSEIAVGYSTIYGDMCGGYNPIKDLYKTRLYSICEWRNSCHEDWMKGPNGLVIPKSILEKSPTDIEKAIYLEFQN